MLLHLWDFWVSGGIYLTQIGIRYLMIPAITMATGIVADEAVHK